MRLASSNNKTLPCLCGCVDFEVIKDDWVYFVEFHYKCRSCGKVYTEYELNKINGERD